MFTSSFSIQFLVVEIMGKAMSLTPISRMSRKILMGAHVWILGGYEVHNYAQLEQVWLEIRVLKLNSNGKDCMILNHAWFYK